MKTIVKNYIYSTFNERGMKAFEKKVAKLLKDNGIEGNFICHNAYLERAGGYNSYNRIIELEFNKEILNFSEHTNDSQMWDAWENPTTKDKRDLFLAVLENTIKELKEYILENTNYES